MQIRALRMPFRRAAKICCREQFIRRVEVIMPLKILNFNFPSFTQCARRRMLRFFELHLALDLLADVAQRLALLCI